MRTDYWVSQGRKFCEFCKCSIADNKPSIEFHEKGKKHKENVAKRLTEMQKKASKDAKDALNFEKEMKRIEAAALQAYVKDVKVNADFTSQLIRAGVESLPEIPVVEASVAEPKPKPKPTRKAAVKRSAPTKKWMEAESEEGHTYYWNVDTGESVWEVPAEGFMSLDEQKNQSSAPSTHGKFHKGKKPKKPFKPSNSAKKPKVVPEKKEAQLEEFGPVLPQYPYGMWKKVEEKKEGPIDLQLPKQEFIPISVPKIREDSMRTFKEKVATLGCGAPKKGEETLFKKRKFASEARKNMRQRLDEN